MGAVCAAQVDGVNVLVFIETATKDVERDFVGSASKGNVRIVYLFILMHVVVVKRLAIFD